MRSLVYATAGALLLAGCGATPAAVQTNVAQLEVALTAAEKAAFLYATRPQCPTAAPLCSDAATIAKIKAADNAAYAAVKGARAAPTDTAQAARASAAVAALVSMIPAGQ